MKKFFITLYCAAWVLQAAAQRQEMEQLRLDLEKLVQMKEMLNHMYQGYTTLVNGYASITAQAKGNFDLHRNFLDQLLQVSGTIQANSAIQSIIGKQSQLANEWLAAYRNYAQSGLFNMQELLQLKTQFDQFNDRVSRQVKQLNAVMTPGVLRMNDQERISAIERIDKDVGEALKEEQLLVKEQDRILNARNRRKREVNTMRSLYGLKN
jgi:hypothetical protein